jgi:hypothetical protein
MLATEAYSITTAEAGIEQNVEPYSLSRSYRPALLIGGHIVFGPRSVT